MYDMTVHGAWDGVNDPIQKKFLNIILGCGKVRETIIQSIDGQCERSGEADPGLRSYHMSISEASHMQFPREEGADVLACLPADMTAHSITPDHRNS